MAHGFREQSVHHGREYTVGCDLFIISQEIESARLESEVGRSFKTLLRDLFSPVISHPLKIPQPPKITELAGVYFIFKPYIQSAVKIGNSTCSNSPAKNRVSKTETIHLKMKIYQITERKTKSNKCPQRPFSFVLVSFFCSNRTLKRILEEKRVGFI